MDLCSRGLNVKSFLLLLFFEIVEWDLSILVLDKLGVQGADYVEHVRFFALHVDPARAELRWLQEFRQVSVFGDCQILVRFAIGHDLSRVRAQCGFEVSVHLADEA